MSEDVVVAWHEATGWDRPRLADVVVQNAGDALAVALEIAREGWVGAIDELHAECEMRLAAEGALSAAKVGRRVDRETVDAGLRRIDMVARSALSHDMEEALDEISRIARDVLTRP